jgi:hypothetical protein
MRKKRRSEAEWRSIVASWQASGLSAAAFAASRGNAMSVQSLYTWARKLESRGGPPANVPDFIEVPSLVHQGAGRWIIRLPSGLRVYLPADATIERVASLLRSMEAR